MPDDTPKPRIARRTYPRCEDCGKPFAPSHRGRHPRCEDCGMHFMSAQVRDRHVANAAFVCRPHCRVCGEKFGLPKHLADHAVHADRLCRPA